MSSKYHSFVHKSHGSKTIKVMDDIIKSEVLNIIKNENIQDHQIVINPVTTKGDNNIAVILGITVIGSNKSLHLICKSEPKSEVLLKQFRIDKMFEGEKFFYTILFPLYERFQEKIPRDDRFVNYPKCYSFSKAGLFMADLRKEGFKMLDKKEQVDYEHAKVTMETLGESFH